MNCVICKTGRPAPGTATVTLQRGEATIIFRRVPADLCDNCGENYLSEKVSRDLLGKAATAVASGAEVVILSYAALGMAQREKELGPNPTSRPKP